jgi:hypothetical protein
VRAWFERVWFERVWFVRVWFVRVWLSRDAVAEVVLPHQDAADLE